MMIMLKQKKKEFFASTASKKVDFRKKKVKENERRASKCSFKETKQVRVYTWRAGLALRRNTKGGMKSERSIK